MRAAITSLLFLVFAMRCACAGDASLAPDFSHYPQTDAFRLFINSQTNANFNLIQQTNLLKIVSFYKGDRIGLEYSVTETGQESDVRDVYDWAYQDSHWKQLSEDQLKGLHSAIKELPAESVLPPVERLVVVSFKDGTNWTTRAYDQTNLPPAMHKVYGLIGERSETTNEPKRTGF